VDDDYPTYATALTGPQPVRRPPDDPGPRRP